MAGVAFFWRIGGNMGTDKATITKGDYLDMVNYNGVNTPHDKDSTEPVWLARGFVLVADSWNDDGSHVQVWQRKGKAN